MLEFKNQQQPITYSTSRRDSLLIERDPNKPTCFGIIPLASGVQMLAYGYVLRCFIYAGCMFNFMLTGKGYLCDQPIEGRMVIFFWSLFLMDLVPFYGLKMVMKFIRRDNALTRASYPYAFRLVWISEAIQLTWVVGGAYWLLDSADTDYYMYLQVVFRQASYRFISISLHYYFVSVALEYAEYAMDQPDDSSSEFDIQSTTGHSISVTDL